MIYIMIYIIKMITEYVIFLYKVKVSLYIETSKLKCKRNISDNVKKT